MLQLNYSRTVLSQEINSSSNSKLYLDNVYSSILNNTHPNAVDSDSNSQIETLLNTIKAYQSIETKRERLRYIYEQNQAKAVQNALPNPLSVLSIIQSKSPLKAILSIVYMSVDSKSSYDSYVSEVETKYMQDGWVLDDEAAENLHESRSDAFAYMVKMCNKNNLDGNLALNENAVAEFVKWKNETNVTRKIDFLEKNQEKYSAYGKYWLVLAESYYEASEYQKSLDCIDKYEKMNIDIFRKDHDFAKALTIGLMAARETNISIFYVIKAPHYLDLILKNIENDDWLLRYVAAEYYMDLYAKTKNKEHLQSAYDLIEENVNYLIDEQYRKNDTFLDEVKKQTAKKADTDAKKKEIKNYNKWIEEERKTELPPVYQPLVLNCELLFALADKLKVSQSTKEKIDKIDKIDKMLHASNKPLFLTSQLENKFQFDNNVKFEKPDILFDGSKVTVPVNLLAQGTTIKATVKNRLYKTEYNDWVLDEVDRSTGTTVDKFSAIYQNNRIKKHNFKDGDIVIFEIVPENSYDIITYSFKVSVKNKWMILTDVTFTLEK